MTFIQTSKSPEWYLPKAEAHRVRESFGGSIDLDAASSAKANETIRAKQFYSVTDDGLKRPWFGDTYINAPGTPKGVAKWWEKSIDEWRVGRANNILFWMFNSNGIFVFQDFCLRPFDFTVCLLRDRVAHWTPDLELLKSPSKKQCDQHIRLGICEGSQPQHHTAVVMLSDDLGCLDRFCETWGAFGQIVHPLILPTRSRKAA